MFLTITDDNFTLPEEEPQTVLWSNNPLDDEPDFDYGQNDDDACSECDEEEGYDDG